MKQFCRLAKPHTFLWCLVLAAVLLVSVAAGIGFGPVSIPFSQVWQVMLHRLGGLLTGSALPLEGVRESTQNIVWFLRAPRVLLGGLVGAALTLSGVGMQAFTKNPLAEPYILGISSGASLGAVLAMLLGVSLPVLGRLSVTAGASAGLRLDGVRLQVLQRGVLHLGGAGGHALVLGPAAQLLQLVGGHLFDHGAGLFGQCGVVAGGRCRQAVRQVDGIRRAAAFQQLGHGVFAPDQGVLRAGVRLRRRAASGAGIARCMLHIFLRLPLRRVQTGIQKSSFWQAARLGAGRGSVCRRPRADTARVLYRLKYNTFCRFVP